MVKLHKSMDPIKRIKVSKDRIADAEKNISHGSASVHDIVLKFSGGDGSVGKGTSRTSPGI